MRPSLFLILFAAITSSVATLPCLAQSQGEMTAQSYAEFEKADKKLNAVYQQALTASDDIARQKLITAQKAWIKFRDAQAEIDADEARGGSLANQIRATSETELTEARTAQLKKYIKDQTGQ